MELHARIVVVLQELSVLMIVDVAAQLESLAITVRQSYPAQQVPMELLARIVVL